MKQKSKTRNVIDHIESGKPLTKLDCFKMFQYWNLSDVVLKLRVKHGHDYIITNMLKTTTGSSYAEYRLTNTNHLRS